MLPKLLVIITGLVLCQVAFRYLQPERHSRTSGPERGDVLLPDCLPDKIGIWEKADFQAGEFGKHVCSHQWTYQSEFGTALVSFDQAAFSGWHELTDCYAMSGWTFRERQPLNADSDWPCVQANFVNNGRTSLIMYSLFYDNGTGVVPPVFSVGNETNQDQSAIQRLVARASKPRRGTTRQCQVFFVLNTDDASPILPELLTLHMATRQKLVRAFLKKQEVASLTNEVNQFHSE